jgi:cysteine desulfurase
MRNIYLDYAATTPLDPAVRRVMEPYFFEKYGNPSSLHVFGQEAIAAVDKARETVAKRIGAGFREVIFTGSATEANNLALRGSIRGFTQITRRLTQMGIRENSRSIREHPRPRFIISAIEHESVRETAHDLEKEGVEVVEIPVNREGVFDLKKLEEALDGRTVLVSVMYGNNEVGTIQPIAEIGEIIRNFRNSKSETRNPKQIPSTKSQNSKHLGNSNLDIVSKFGFRDSDFPLLHSDAVQAFQFLDCDVEKLGVDLMTLSAHKIYGPKGVGALYVRQATSDKRQEVRGFMSYVAVSMSPVLTGGGQEFGLRSGTENVPGIVGFAEAARIAARMRAKEAKRIGELRDMLWREIQTMCPKAEMNGVSSGKFRVARGASLITHHSSLTLPNILNVYFPGYPAEELLMKLDRAGIAASAGPACSSRVAEPSRVLRALGHSEKRARQSIRFSLGRFTTVDEMKRALTAIREVLGGYCA